MTRLSFLLVALPSPAAAEQFQDALAYAYAHSPVLGIERANLRVDGEDVLEAKAVGRPRVSVLTTHTEDIEQAIPSQFLPDRTLRSDLAVSVPFYRGGAVRNAVRDAQARFRASSEDYKEAVVQLFGAVAVVYNDVIRDQSIVRYGQQNVNVLEATLRAARGRFRIGDLTVTDVAQAEGRLELAKAGLKAYRAQLITSREEYVRIVGRAPTQIAAAPQLQNLPDSVGEAVSIALERSNILKGQRFRVEATEHRIKAAQAERSFRITGTASVNYFNYLDSIGRALPFRPIMDGFAVRAGVTLDVPLYQGGLPASRVRRARAERSAALEQVTEAQRIVIARTRTAYANWRLALAFQADAEAAIAANIRAVKGAQKEYAMGLRTLLEVLDLEREFLNSQVAHASSERNSNVAAFALLSTMGVIDASMLEGAVPADRDAQPLPSPRGSWSDWADGKRSYDAPGTSTINVAPQNGDVSPTTAEPR
ncbi:TolC family protein [Sandaracinobacteroides saxicola]|uniref:TolC family protein n=1 Tax=Sandaracinobacteroides saxicola TaxID=2759707 RepID=A0A7G5IFG4_9SPHN|nr:TolC family protein [Sandaracinobacteroides saxicola]QMW22106.1 TolC family protein [Sandaracinobacteroides saxicola]